mgnify:CR=1 FL=1
MKFRRGTSGLKTAHVLQLVTLICFCTIMNATAQSKMKRSDLLQASLKERVVSSVKVIEIEFEAGQKGPYHRHPCPVVGYIVEGTCLMQVEGEPARILKAGDAFFEPADIPIIHFDNYSDSKPLKFVAYYLLNGEEELIELLPEKRN